MVTSTVTTKVNNSNYDVSADQWNAIVVAVKNQPYSYIIYKSGSTYYARNGATGAVDYSEAALADALTEAFTALTADGGVIFLSQLAFPMTSFASIPEGVRVVCDYGAEHWEYINSADSVGSPYTVSVGSSVNVGYYLAQDGEGRICFISTTVSGLFNAVLATSPSSIYFSAGTYPVDTQISLIANLKLYSDCNAVFTTTISTSLNAVFVANSNNCFDGIIIAGGETQKTNAVKGIDIIGVRSNITITNCRISGFAWGVYSPDNYKWVVNNLIVTQNTFTDFKYNAISLLRSNNIKISSNHISVCGASGISVNTINGVISENTIIDSSQDFDYYAGITITNPRNNDEYGEGLVVSNNAIRYTTAPSKASNGIVLSAENLYDSYVDHCVITGNTIQGFGDANSNVGIYLHKRGGSPELMNIRNILVANNVVYDMKYGYLLMGDNVVCSGNAAYNVTTGVWSAGSPTLPSSVVISSNTLYGKGTTADYDGIRLTGLLVANLVSNNFIGNFSMGITEEYTGYDNADYNFITSNYIQNCTTPINVVGANTNSTNNFTP